MSTWDVGWRIVGTIFALALVCLLAWVVLRWVNRLQPGASGSPKRLIRVLDRVGTGKNQSLLLVRVKDTVLLVAVSEHTVEKLAEWNADEGGFELPQPGEAPPSFSSALKDAAAKMGLGSFGKKDGQDGGGPDDE